MALHQPGPPTGLTHVEARKRRMCHAAANLRLCRRRELEVTKLTFLHISTAAAEHEARRAARRAAQAAADAGGQGPQGNPAAAQAPQGTPAAAPTASGLAQNAPAPDTQSPVLPAEPWATFDLLLAAEAAFAAAAPTPNPTPTPTSSHTAPAVRDSKPHPSSAAASPTAPTASLRRKAADLDAVPAAHDGTPTVDPDLTGPQPLLKKLRVTFAPPAPRPTRRFLPAATAEEAARHLRPARLSLPAAAAHPPSPTGPITPPTHAAQASTPLPTVEAAGPHSPLECKIPRTPLDCKNPKADPTGSPMPQMPPAGNRGCPRPPKPIRIKLGWPPSASPLSPTTPTPAAPLPRPPVAPTEPATPVKPCALTAPVASAFGRTPPSPTLKVKFAQRPSEPHGAAAKGTARNTTAQAAAPAAAAKAAAKRAARDEASAAAGCLASPADGAPVHLPCGRRFGCRTASAATSPATADTATSPLQQIRVTFGPR